MANTVTQTTLIKGQREFINYITLVSDGSEETDLVIFDSSAVFAAVGLTDTMNASIERIIFSGAKLANVGTIKLEWDATTDVLALPIAFAALGDSSCVLDFSRFGGLKNYAGTGKTGDLLMTTTTLDSGDAFTLILQMRIS